MHGGMIRLKALVILRRSPGRRSPGDLRAFVMSEIERWARVIKAAGVSVE